MRSIKFRAWYRNKMYRYVEHCTYPDGSSGVNCLGYLECGRLFSPGDDVDLMQFTGLTDRNGVEIYESDYVCLGWGGPYKEIAKVVWEGFAWGFEFSDGRKQPIEAKWTPESQVVGNIYENPEQLDQFIKEQIAAGCYTISQEGGK